MELDLLVSARVPAVRRPPSKQPSSASASRSPSAETASEASRSIPGRSRRRRCARPPWSSSPRGRWTCSTRGGSRRPSVRRWSSCSTRGAVVAAETAITREQFRRNHVGCCRATRASRTTTRSARGPDEPIRAPDRDRDRHAPGAAELGRVRRPHDHRLRRALKLESRVPRTMTIVGAGVARRRRLRGAGSGARRCRSGGRRGARRRATNTTPSPPGSAGSGSTT